MAQPLVSPLPVAAKANPYICSNETCVKVLTVRVPCASPSSWGPTTQTTTGIQTMPQEEARTSCPVLLMHTTPKPWAKATVDDAIAVVAMYRAAVTLVLLRYQHWCLQHTSLFERTKWLMNRPGSY